MNWQAFLIGAIVPIPICAIYGFYTYKKYTRRIDKMFDDALNDFKRGF